MADIAVRQPKSMTRPKIWSDEVEEAYRFQIAGYRDEVEYKEIQKTDHVRCYPAIKQGNLYGWEWTNIQLFVYKN